MNHLRPAVAAHDAASSWPRCLRARSASLAALTALTLVLVLALEGPAHAVPDLADLGRRIYEQGIGVDGRALRAFSAGDSVLAGGGASCTACHRRSGMGSREGRLAVSPVTGPILYAKAAPFWPNRPGRASQSVVPLRQDSRSAYDDSSLALAIREGVDPDGRPLDPLMPRYALDDIDMRALVAYLRELAVAPVRGWEPGVLHLATVIAADADPVRSAVVVTALTAWAQSSTLRGSAIDLRIWRLEGPEQTWNAQLRDFERAQPVYAILSGAGGARWAPVRDFCEQAALPCLFPIVDLAPSDPDDFYTLYFSRGVPLEARMLARRFDRQEPRPQRIVQLVGGAAGAAAAKMLAAELVDIPIEAREWQDASPASAIEDMKPGDVVVGWLGAAQIQALTGERPQGLGVTEVVFSAQLAAPEKVQVPAAWRREALWVSARADPQHRHGKGVLGLLPWATQLKLPLDEEALMAEVYAATYFFSDALARMRGHRAREFLLETLESAHYTQAAGSAFFSPSLGPGQREAAKAGHLLGFGGQSGRDLVVLGSRLAP
jgi:hypothetical protein